MAGLVGIISHGRAAAVAEPELAELVDAFVAVWGGTSGQRFPAGEWARFGVVDIGPEATVGSAGSSWVAAVGAVHGDEDFAHAGPSELDGQFAGARYDAERDLVEVFTDPFG